MKLNSWLSGANFQESLKENKTMKEEKIMSKPPSLQDVKTGMELSKAYRGIIKVIRYFVTLPVVTATVERSFSQMKFVKTRLRNRLARLMRIVIEGPELTSVNLMKFWLYLKNKIVVLHYK